MISRKQKDIIEVTYKMMLKHLIQDIALHKDKFIETCEEHNMEHDHDFYDLAQEAFLAAVKLHHDHTYSQSAAIIEAKKIINP